jgi:hypothetical protein
MIPSAATHSGFGDPLSALTSRTSCTVAGVGGGDATDHAQGKAAELSITRRDQLSAVLTADRRWRPDANSACGQGIHAPSDDGTQMSPVID